MAGAEVFPRLRAARSASSEHVYRAMCVSMTSISRSKGLSHVAMSVAEGALTPGFRTEVVEFYGRHFGWTEIESLRGRTA